MQHAGDKDHSTVSWYGCPGLVYNTLQWYPMWGDVVQNRCKRSSPICARPRSMPRAGPEKLCKVLPAFHAITEGDITSGIAFVAKKKAWEVLQCSEAHQESLVGLSPTHNNAFRINCDKFICSLYPAWRTHQPLLMNLKFCHKSALLLPTSDSGCQHVRRVTYQNLYMENGINCMTLSAFPQRKCLKEDSRHPQAPLYDIFNTIWRVIFWAFVLQNCIYFKSVLAIYLPQNLINPELCGGLLSLTANKKSQKHKSAYFKTETYSCYRYFEFHQFHTITVKKYI